MRKAIAIAIPQNENPFRAALESAGNFSALLIDFMYGTPKRAKLTYAFAVALFILGAAMSSTANALQACPA